MKLIPGGTFQMGSDAHHPEEAPVREVRLEPFRISPYAVTNQEYAAFVAATGYATVAERPLDPADFPGAPAANLHPGSMVFTRTPGPVDLRHLDQWWRWTPGASWQHPEGPASTLAGRERHPVVHVAYGAVRRVRLLARVAPGATVSQLVNQAGATADNAGRRTAADTVRVPAAAGRAGGATG